MWIHLVPSTVEGWKSKHIQTSRFFLDDPGCCGWLSFILNLDVARLPRSWTLGQSARWSRCQVVISINALVAKDSRHYNTRLWERLHQQLCKIYDFKTQVAKEVECLGCCFKFCVGGTCKTWIFEVNIVQPWSTSKTAAFIVSSGSQSGWHVWQPCCTCWEVYQRYSVCFESSNETWTSLGYAFRSPQCRIGETSETWPLKSFKWYVEICNVECVRFLMCFVF